MWIALPLLLVAAALLFEYRLRRPDHLILFDSRGTIGFRKARWYPRHFSLALPGTTHLMEIKVEATAKGSIPVVVRLVTTVAASRSNVAALIRVGGWSGNAVAKAAKEFEAVLQGQVKQHTETAGVEQISSERLRGDLLRHAEVARSDFGLDIVSLTVQAVDPVDPSIADALRQRESARILEQTEVLSQNARVAAAKAKLAADDQIAMLEHELEVKRIDIKNKEQQQEARLAQQRVEDELARSRMKLAFDREEMALLKENPQLLLLTPQAARLAEASQALKNARTVISLSPADAEQGTKMAGLFQILMENFLNGNAPARESSK